MAEHGDAADEVRTRLAADPDPEVRKMVSQSWTQAPESVRRALLTDADAGVRAAAMSPWHPPPPPDLHSALLADPTTCPLVLPHVTLALDLAAHSAASPDDEVRQAVAAHPDLPASIRDRLARDSDVLVRIRLVENPRTPEGTRAEVLAALDAEEGEAERWIIRYFLGNAWRDKTSMGWLWEAPLTERLTYLDSPHFFFRRAVAASQGLPQHAVDRLLTDPDLEVRRIVARTNDVPGDVLERLVRDHGETMHIRPLLVEHPNFPPAAFARFAVSDHARLRRLALHDKDLAATLVGRLAADPEPYVRRAAAEHPNLPAHCLPAMLTDADMDIAEAADAAPALPVRWIHRLLEQAGI